MGRKVLVVDDDRDLVNLLSLKISQAGYEVLTAYDGYQAISITAKENPDLIVLDIRLPAGGGAGVLKALKGSFKTHDIPVIVITAYDFLEKEVSEYRVEEFMIKPLNPDELVERIAKYI